MGGRSKSIKKNPVKVLRNIQNLPCHQHKKNPIPGEDGELHLKKVRVITQQNQEIMIWSTQLGGNNPTRPQKRPLFFKTFPIFPYCLHVHINDIKKQYCIKREKCIINVNLS